MESTESYLRQAIALARANVARGGRPFGALLVKDGRVVASAVNEMVASGDPTAHAELQAIRAATRALGMTRLDGAVMYASGHPCPMCLSAMYLTGVARVFYAYTNEEAEAYGLSTRHIYADLARDPGLRFLPLVCAPVPDAGEHLYELWRRQGTA